MLGFVGYMTTHALDFHTAYRNAEGLPWVLPVVRTVEAQMASDPTLTHEYLPIDGLKAFTEAANRFLLGESSQAITQNRVREGGREGGREEGGS